MPALLENPRGFQEDSTQMRLSRGLPFGKKAMERFTPNCLSKEKDPWWGEEKLNRALVAGLMLEVIFSQPPLPDDPGARRRRLKEHLKTALVSRLAGHIPLHSFRSMAHNFDRWFDLFYPLISPSGPDESGQPRKDQQVPALARGLQEDLLRETLARWTGLLPTRRHRKIDREKLLSFFRQTGGKWFRLKDFEQFFRMDRKTAWEYIQKLLRAGLLYHNQGRSAAVRYRLAPGFLQGTEPKPQDSGEEKAL